MDFSPSRLDAIAAAVKQATQRPDLQHSVVQCLLAWFRTFNSDHFSALAVEKEFAVPMKDLKDRPFWLVGRRDFDGLHHIHGDVFLGEYKTHHGPWRKSDSVDKMLAEWWEGWHLNLQAAVYLRSLLHDYPDRLHALRYLVRVAIKPGRYNEATAQEKWFQFDPVVHQRQIQGFVCTATQMLDALVSGVYPTNDLACFSKYNKRCPYWGPCQNKAALVQLHPWKHHLTFVEALEPKWPAIDVTSVRLYRECPQKWYQRYILKREEARSDALEEGSAFHAGLEAAIAL